MVGQGNGWLAGRSLTTVSISQGDNGRRFGSEVGEEKGACAFEALGQLYLAVTQVRSKLSKPKAPKGGVCCVGDPAIVGGDNIR